MTIAVGRFLIGAVLALAGGGVLASPVDPGDEDIIEMLRDAQSTTRAAFRQGRTNLQLLITREGAANPAILDGSVTWIESDFLLKFKISDPSHFQFPRAEQEFGSDWTIILWTRDGMCIYKSNTGALYSRKADPGSMDPRFNLNPWINLFISWPLCATPGRLWAEMIGPHPSMKGVMTNSVFRFEHLAGGDIKQSRLDKDGFVTEIVFSAEADFLVTSMLGRDRTGDNRESATCRYRRSGKAIVPLESEYYMVTGPRAPLVKYLYKFSDWDVRTPVPRDTLTIEHFTRMAQELKKAKARNAEKSKSGAAE